MRGGRSQSLPATVRRVITARVRDAPGAAVRVRPALELDAAVMQGDSGAPVLDGEGRVVGMVFAQASDREDRSYALDGRAVRSGAR
jgi:S1-C subfamily serine protease